MARRMPANTPCGYCFENWAQVYDHIVPRSFGGPTKQVNLYPACNRCSLLVGARVFDSLDAKRNFIRKGLGLPEELPIRLPPLPKVPKASVRTRPTRSGPSPKKKTPRASFCGACNGEFSTTRPLHRFCSAKCRSAYARQNGCPRCRHLTASQLSKVYDTATR